MSENPEKVEKARKLIFEYLQSNKNYRGKLGKIKMNKIILKMILVFWISH
jgi:hypothetical protein